MTVASLLAHLRRAKRMSKPKVTIQLYVFTDDGRIPVGIIQVDNAMR